MTTRLGVAGVLLAGAAVLAVASPIPAAAEDQLTIVSWGGAYSESQREAFTKPFIKDTGTKVTEEDWNGEIAKIRAMVESNSVTWDVVDFDTQTVLAACAEGLLEVLDWGKLGVDKAKFIGGDLSECAIPNIVYSTVIAYDADKLKEGPKTIADVFDLEKFPGKRGLRKDSYANLEWALIADGVAAADVYKVLNTPEGVDRAFKKLDTIKDQIVWWDAGAQPPQLLADGQVVMTSAWNGRIYDAVKKEGKNFKIMWDSQHPDWDFWVIPKGSKNLEAAYKYISYASQPDKMANQTQYISYGPANEDALPNVDPAVLEHLPTAPDNMATHVPQDPQFWADKGEELDARLNAWIAK